MTKRTTMTLSALLICVAAGGRAEATSPSISCINPPGLCDQMCADQAALLTLPSTTATTIYAGRCDKVTTLGGSSQSAVGCQCALDTQGNASLSLVPGLSSDDCLLQGRSGCLYTKSEFPGCIVGAAPDACDSICADVQTRLRDDQKRTIKVDVADAACVEGHGCYCVLEVEGACYFGKPQTTNAVACGAKAADVYEQRFGKPDSSQPGGCAAAGSAPSVGLAWLLLLGLALVHRRAHRAG